MDAASPSRWAAQTSPVAAGIDCGAVVIPAKDNVESLLRAFEPACSSGRATSRRGIYSRDLGGTRQDLTGR